MISRGTLFQENLYMTNICVFCIHCQFLEILIFALPAFCIFLGASNGDILGSGTGPGARNPGKAGEMGCDEALGSRTSETEGSRLYVK